MTSPAWAQWDMSSKIETDQTRGRLEVKIVPDRHIVPCGFDINLDPHETDRARITQAEGELVEAVMPYASEILGNSIALVRRDGVTETLRFENNGQGPTIIYCRKESDGPVQIIRATQERGLKISVAERVVHILQIHKRSGEKIAEKQYVSPEEEVQEREWDIVQALGVLEKKYKAYFDKARVKSVFSSRCPDAIPLVINFEFRKFGYRKHAIRIYPDNCEYPIEEIVWSSTGFSYGHKSSEEEPYSYDSFDFDDRSTKHVEDTETLDCLEALIPQINSVGPKGHFGVSREAESYLVDDVMGKLQRIFDFSGEILSSGEAQYTISLPTKSGSSVETIVTISKTDEEDAVAVEIGKSFIVVSSFGEGLYHLHTRSEDERAGIKTKSIDISRRKAVIFSEVKLEGISNELSNFIIALREVSDAV